MRSIGQRGGGVHLWRFLRETSFCVAAVKVGMLLCNVWCSLFSHGNVSGAKGHLVQVVSVKDTSLVFFMGSKLPSLVRSSVAPCGVSAKKQTRTRTLLNLEGGSLLHRYTLGFGGWIEILYKEGKIEWHYARQESVTFPGLCVGYMLRFE